MRIQKSQLKKIILEEYKALLLEKRFKQTEPSNPYHDSDGRFSSYRDSKSWSLEDKQKEMKSGKNVKPCGRGQRRKCKNPQELKWEGAEEPRSDSTSRYRRDDPRYENDRMRKDKAMPGYSQMKSLAQGIAEIVDEALGNLNEGGKDTICYNHQQLARLRQQVFQQTLAVISQYEDAKKLSPHLKKASK